MAVETQQRWLDEHGVELADLSKWALIVLGWSGDEPFSPGEWESALIRLLSLSDDGNTDALFKAFPGATAAWVIWKEGDRSELARLARLPV